MKKETRNLIIDANTVLTLELAKGLVGNFVSICCKDEAGNFSEVVDGIQIQQVSKVKGKKQYVIIDQYGGFSYVSGATDKAPFQSKGGTAYFIMH